MKINRIKDLVQKNIGQFIDAKEIRDGEFIVLSKREHSTFGEGFEYATHRYYEETNALDDGHHDLTLAGAIKDMHNRL